MHVQEMHMSLIYMGKLNDKGFSTSTVKGDYKISKGAFSMDRGLKIGTLYTLIETIRKPNVVVAEKQGPSPYLWHKCLGYMSEKGLKSLLENICSQV